METDRAQHLVVIEHELGEQRTVFVDRDLLVTPGEAAAYVSSVLGPDWFVREVLPA
ncbi:hypothetical protein [Nocardia ninae]|uniref:hypothetical protein n=1 Tax=Nocardia ninae TaxID=356145 RepID=UPI001649D32A|nr:hypothetical protein [Nocardia ninae]